MTFSDFENMERVCRVLLEKLDKSVCVGTPHFYHSAECLSQMRYEKTHAAKALLWMKRSSCNKCMFVRALGGVHVCQQLKMLSRKPVKSVSSWAKLWDPPYWSKRRRRESGGMRMRRMKAEARVERPFLSFPVHPQSPPLHGCLCPSASETKAGKNSEDVCR